MNWPKRYQTIGSTGYVLVSVSDLLGQGFMGKVLVLNASYEPLNITSWRRAVVLVLKEKAEQVEHNGKFVYRDFPLPTVIRLRQYVRVPYKEVRCNVKKGNRTPKEARMILKQMPRRPYSSLYFEVTKHLRNGVHQEWRKYVIGM